MKLNQKIRKFWHDIYYKNESTKLIDFALKCQHITAAVDLHQKPKNIIDHLRFWLHLSLCQACKNYYDFSRFLAKKIQEKPLRTDVEIQKLNKSLLEKHGHKN